MSISSYKEAERYRMRTNKNLTRSFYLDTRRTLDEEPFARDQIQDPQFEQLELADGGSVERQGFKYGTSAAFKEFLEKQILKNKINYNSLDELINKSNTNINQENAIKVLKNQYPDSFKIKVKEEYFPIHENPKENLKAIEGFKKLKEWEKNPTAENWFSIFRVTEPSGKTKPSKFSQGLRNYVQGKEGEGATFNKYFDKIELDEKLYDEIKTYDKDLANTLKAKAGNQAAKKAIFEKSDQVINDINEQFKFYPNSSDKDLASAIYGNQFDNADLKTQLILLTQTSDDVAKYLKVLQGARPEQFKKIKPPDQETINDIVDNIAAGKKGGFRFQEGTLRQYKFDIRDTLLGLKPGTTSQLRQKVVFGGKRVIDESVGLSATYERAPGYTEASQFLSPETNRIKGVVIDRPFSKTLDKALEGDLSGVKEYNKIAKQFKKEYPGADVPIIEIGKNPKEVIKYFDSFSKESQKNILDIYNKSNISIRTNSKPLSVLVDEYQKAEKLEGKAKTAAFTALGLTSAGVANAEEVSDLTPMEASVLPDLSKIKEGIQENPIASSALAAAAPLATEKGRDIYGKIGKGLLKTLNVLGTPLGVAAYEAVGPGGLRESIQEGRTTEDIATDPFTYASLPFANIASQAVSNPTLQKILSLGLPARAVGALTPIGLTAIGATTAYQGIKSLKEEIERRSLLTPEQREQEDVDREAERGRLAETGQFATGGRVGFKDGPKDPSKRKFIKGAGVVGAVGLASKFIPDLFQAAKKAKVVPKKASFVNIVKPLGATETKFPEWFPSLVNRLRKEGNMKPIYATEEIPLTEKQYLKLSEKGTDRIYDEHLTRTQEYIDEFKQTGKPRYYQIKDKEDIIGYEYIDKNIPDVKAVEYNGEEMNVYFKNNYGQSVEIQYVAPGKKTKEGQFSVADARPESGSGYDSAPDFEQVYVTDIDEVLGGSGKVEQYATKAKTPRYTKGAAEVDEAEGRALSEIDRLKDEGLIDD